MFLFFILISLWCDRRRLYNDIECTILASFSDNHLFIRLGLLVGSLDNQSHFFNLLSSFHLTSFERNHRNTTECTNGPVGRRGDHALCSKTNSSHSDTSDYMSLASVYYRFTAYLELLTYTVQQGITSAWNTVDIFEIL